MAVLAHGDQRYGSHPYVVHLADVAAVCVEFGTEAEVIAWLHDALEDTSLARSEIALAFGERVAHCVDLLSDPPGKNRKERKALAYARLAAVSESDAHGNLALVVKAADRLANIRACVEHGTTDKLAMYRAEHTQFTESVLRPALNGALFDRMSHLLRMETKTAASA